MSKKLTDGMKQKPNGVWEMQVTIEGKRKSFSSKDPRAVWEKYSDYMRGLTEGKQTAGKFSTVAKAWWEEHQQKIAYGSLRPYKPAYERAVQRFGNQDIADIRPQDCNAYILSLAQKYAYKTVANHLSVLTMIFTYAIMQGLIASNPCQYVTVPAHLRRSTRQPLTEAQRRAVQQSTGPDALLAKLILYTGARCGEALALQWRDIDFKAGTVSISKAVVHHGNTPVISPTKTAAGIRTVPLLNPLCETLTPGEPDEYLIGGAKPITKSHLESLWVRYTRSLNLGEVQGDHWQPSIDRHQIRHEYATMLYEAGIDTLQAKALMGHTDIITTQQIYTHIRESKTQSAADKLNAKLSSELQTNCRPTQESSASKPFQ